MPDFYALKAKKARQAVRSLGGTALKGTTAQKRWGEQIRYEFLESIESELALEVAIHNSLTEHAKFWIETREVDRKELEEAMHKYRISTRLMNNTEFNSGEYKEQEKIRESALKVLNGTSK